MNTLSYQYSLGSIDLLPSIRIREIWTGYFAGQNDSRRFPWSHTPSIRQKLNQSTLLSFQFRLIENEVKNQFVSLCNKIRYYKIYYTVYFYPFKSLIYIGF